MTATIREDHVFTDTYTCVLGKLSTISDPSHKSKWIYSAFPKVKVETENMYPILIIQSPDVTYTPFTFREKRGPIRFTFDIFSTNAEQMDDLASQVVNKMELNEDNFLASGIAVMRFVGTSYNQYPRENFRVHNKTLNYEFDFGWYP